MNKKIIFSVAICSVAIILIILAYPIDQKSITETLGSTQGFSYDSNTDMKSLLELRGISMSKPISVSGDSIEKYCKFYDDDRKQNSVKYCTSTELKDPENVFLGNIHMTGNPDSPDTIIGIIQTDPFMNNIDLIKVVFEKMIESNVCTCWQDQKPGNLESVSAWVDAAKIHHLQAKSTTSNSKIDGLAQRHLLLEITTNTEGYLWKFVITN